MALNLFHLRHLWKYFEVVDSCTFYSLSSLHSTILLTNIVGVGSSGALMGMLGAWVVFILYTWNKVPQNSKCQRNCQLFSVLFAITVTMMFSFISYVDWAAHLGGLVQGVLLGLCLLSGEVTHIGYRV
jgi:membrane associated rhomboid family serine protease